MATTTFPARNSGMSRHTRRRIKSIVVHVLGVLATFIMLAPLTWVVTTSLRLIEDIVVFPPRIIPKRVTIQPYVDMWDAAPLFKFLTNSVVVSLTATAIVLVLSVLAAYGFVRFRFRGARLLLTFILVSQSLPGASILLPVFRTVLELGMIDTRRGLILVYTGFITPFCTWLLIGYFRSIPAELQDAALVDGASNLQVLFRIVVPLSLPAIVAVATFAFLGAWNEFLFGFILTRSESQTIAVGLVTSYF